ncbi:CHASE2 domain-containing protein [Parvibium lacunae]|uniref:histidine kinase n=1 Tax=Parvibium lacunae TaxID=1888893 RepID=A0A368L1Y0_9BURK|nr:CHASE2 domain-containing protein [Parvibium lacunae]RCS57566.1 CHASE2 domain-containing protein [Parvibium lacunae]
MTKSGMGTVKQAWRQWVAQARSTRGQWLGLTLGLCCLASYLGWQNGLGRIDALFYDTALSHYRIPADPRIVIIAIDDDSIGQLGRWPWSRQIHAALVEQLTRSHPAAIGLDILFNEPVEQDNDLSDLTLAKSIAKAGNVVLPVIAESSRAWLHQPGSSSLRAALPIPLLAANARSLGHIHVELDQDSLVRSVFLREGQPATAMKSVIPWPHFSLALLEAAGNSIAQAPLPGQRVPSYLSNAANQLDWQRDYWIHLPFAGPPGQFTTYSYAAVLRGEVRPDLLRDKFILVGATAAGLWDAYPTPVSGHAQPMPGVEISANVLNALLQERTIQHAKPWQNAIFALIWPLLVMLMLARVRPRVALLGVVLLSGMVMLLSFLALRYGNDWFAPAAPLAAMLLAYPLWSWRRLDAAHYFMHQQLQALAREPDWLPQQDLSETDTPRSAWQVFGPLRDPLEQDMLQLHEAIQRIRDLRQFVSDSLESLPDATFVTTLDGHVLLANRQARQWFQKLGREHLDSVLLPYLLNETTPQDSRPDFSWWHLFEENHYRRYAEGVEGRDQLGRDLMIHSGPISAARGQTIGWIATLIDMSAIRAAERQRDETLRFLSHDIRSPLSAILTLVDLQRTQSLQLPIEQTLAQIERQAGRSLTLADDFVQLARAETQEYQFQHCVIEDILDQAIDDSYALAIRQQATITTDYVDTDCVLIADRELLLRALQNLLNNALKYSPPQRTVLCWTRIEPNLTSADLIVGIRDQGYGIAAADQPKLFRRFTRFQHPDQPRIEGIGLGLTFVKTVVEKHKGQIEFTSNPGLGTEFRLRFPVRLNTLPAVARQRETAQTSSHSPR